MTWHRAELDVKWHYHHQFYVELKNKELLRSHLQPLDGKQHVALMAIPNTWIESMSLKKAEKLKCFPKNSDPSHDSINVWALFKAMALYEAKLRTNERSYLLTDGCTYEEAKW